MNGKIKVTASAHSDDWKVETGDYDVAEYLESLSDEKLVAIFHDDYAVRDGAVEFYAERDGHPSKALATYCGQSGEGFEAKFDRAEVSDWIKTFRPNLVGAIVGAALQHSFKTAYEKTR